MFASKCTDVRGQSLAPAILPWGKNTPQYPITRIIGAWTFLEQISYILLGFKPKMIQPM